MPAAARRRLLLWLGLAAAAAGRTRAADEAPLRIVTGFAAGGASDIVARTYAQGLQRALQRTVLVDARPGADGTLAAQAVARAAPDGATLLLGSNTALVAVPALREPAPYDPFSVFAPVCGLGRFAMTLLVHPALPVRTTAELLALLERRPDAYAAAFSNSSAELAVAQLVGRRRVLRVPYKGDVPALTDLVGGRVHMMFATGANAAPFLADGRLRRLGTAPGGGLDVDIEPWLGLFGPAGLPLVMRERIAAAAAATLDDPASVARLRAQGFEAEPLGPSAFDAYFRRAYARFVAAARRSGLTLER